jgi:hypothetical protein
MALLRKAAERTVEALWTRTGQFLNALTADDCWNFIATPAMCKSARIQL